MLKLSGEVLGNKQTGECIDPDALASMARRVARIVELGVQIGIVLGGGNIFRGLRGEAKGVNRTTGDNMGMLATIINGLALQETLERLVQPTRVQTAIQMAQVAEPYIRRKAIRHLEKGRVVIFVGGTGNPFMTTDTTAALRAVEIDAEVILMGKNGTDGVYSADPKLDPNAEFLPEVSYIDVLNRGLKVMDSTAISLCMDNDLPICVFDLMGANLHSILEGDRVGTLVS